MISLAWFFGDQEPLDDVRTVRHAVFVREQGIPEGIVFDANDAGAVHLVLYAHDVPVSAGRIWITRDDFVIGRVATLKEHRGRGYATGLMQALISAITQMSGEAQVLHAQQSARGFYEKLGFLPIGEEYIEAGIPHITMRRTGPIGCEAAHV